MARISTETAKTKMIERYLWPIAEFKNTQERWLCVCMKCGNFVTPRYNNVVNKGAGGCKKCATEVTINKLRLDPEVAKSKMIERKLWPIAKFEKTLSTWLCVCMECGEFVTPIYANVVTRKQGGCKFCSIKAKTSDATAAKAAMIERGVWPIEDFRNTSDKWLCVCMECGKFVTPRYNSVVHKGNGGCEHCGRRELDPEEAKKRMISHDLWPITKFPGSNHPWLCVCIECGEFVTPRYGGTAGRGRGCKFCAGIALTPETAKARMIKRGMWPIETFKKSGEKWLSVCMKCGEFNSARYDSVASGNQGGCTACSTSGFRERDPAWIYLVVNDNLNAAKVGICNIGTGRIDKHEGRGWILYKYHPLTIGADARTAEKLTISTWRSRGEGWGAVLAGGTEKYDGFTETVSLTRTDKTITSVETLWLDVTNAVAHLNL
ncbi:hypothetical protein [Streptosporangium roseum]|uniref:hypothetical protein n=1 Tax=Streptosporangium roseum TaxID=2001 RepID=UPI003331FFDF